MPPCLTLSNIRYVSRIKWSNPEKGVASSLTPRCSNYWKGAFWSPSTTVESLQRGNIGFPTSVLGMTLNCIWWWGFSPGVWRMWRMCHYSSPFSPGLVVLFKVAFGSNSIVQSFIRIIIIYHHHVTPSARISLIFSRHTSLSFIAPGLVFRATSRMCTELLYVGSSWSPGLCSSMWRGPQEYITYELVPTSPTVSRMSGSSNFDSFRDRWSVPVQLLLCRVLPPGLVQYCLQHFCVVTVKLFLHTFS